MTRAPISVVGVSHHTAGIADRERFAFPPDVARGVLEGASPDSLLLSTCNRTELYALSEPEPLLERLLAAAAGTDVDPRLLFAHRDEDAVRHAFEVAAGLDSMVVGEPQILGQVKRALRDAREAGSLGVVLDQLARRALTVGRRVRHETDLGAGLPSIPKVATGMARLVLGELRGARLLVVGTGKMGDLTARTLVRVGADSVVVTNRTPGPAAELAERIGGRAAPIEELETLLSAADIVICCTASQDPVVDRSSVEAAVRGRPPGRRLVLIDIAVPRDVAADVREVDGARLYDMDDLRGWSSEAVAPAAIEAARAIVAEEARSFMAWRAARAAVPTIREMHERAEAILDVEVRHAAGEDAERLREFGRRLMKKLLHDPVTRLRAGAASDDGVYIDVARDLFALDRETPGRLAEELRSRKEGEDG
ncbi:MAG TPA: glutamyl-tRNA reductase [Gemmatimonadota bacterium]|nr:glutamyl-tRNA reductase [Gemmatimonadota bacterium]